LYRVHLACAGFELTTSVVISTDCIGSCKSNYYAITTTTARLYFVLWTKNTRYILRQTFCRRQMV